MDDRYRHQAEAFSSFLLTLPKTRKRVGDTVRGRCPLPEHEDRNGSFGYDIAKDAWACSCGSGKGSELMARLGFRWDGQVAPAASVKPVETEYPLQELDGTVVAYHIRRDYGPKEKRFSWRVPNLPGEGLHGIRKEELPLYGLPRLAQAPAERPVVLVEGERKADALQKVAGDVCVVLGTVTGAPPKPRQAGLPWPLSCPSESRLGVLRGRRVWLWPDHDDPGREHMRQAAERLKVAGVKAETIEWSGARSEGDDAGNFVQRGGTAEDLAAMLAPRPVDWRGAFGVQPVKATELAPYIDMAVPYIVKPIIVRGSLTQIQGIQKGGKSAFSLYLSLCAATGTWPFPQHLRGEDEGPLRVVYIAWEDPKIMMAKRLSLYAAGLGFERTFLPEHLTFLFGPDIFIERADHVEALRSAIQELKPDLVFIDTLSHVHLCDENAASEMKIPMKNLDRLARETQIGIIYLHHTGKYSSEKAAQDKSRGSGAIAAAWHVLVDWGLREPGSNTNPVEIQSKYEHEWTRLAITYSPMKDEFGVVQGIRWDIDCPGAESPAHGPKVSSSDRKRTRLMDVIAKLQATQEWVTCEQVTAVCNLGLDERSVRRHLQRMCEEGYLESRTGPKGALHYKPAAGGNLVERVVERGKTA